MPRTRREIATRITASLRETEDSVDSALAQASDFLAMLPAARREAQVSASMGHEAVERVAAAIAALTDARRELVLAHEVLADVQQQLGLGETAYGPFINKPDYPPKEARLAESRLRLVSRDAA